MSKDQAEAQAKAAHEDQVRAEGFDKWLIRCLKEAWAAIPPIEEDHE